MKTKESYVDLKTKTNQNFIMVSQEVECMPMFDDLILTKR